MAGTERMKNSHLVKVGEVFAVEVFKVTNFGAFVRLPGQQKGLIHISQIAEGYVKDINEHIKLGDKVEAKVISVNDGKIDLTLKKEKEHFANSFPPGGKRFKSSSLEERLNQFLNNSK